MSSAAPTESITAKTSRKSKNCWAGFMACCSDTKQQAVIKKLEYNITARQREFGVEYMKLIDKEASEEELKACVDKAKKAIEKLKDEIKEHETAMEQNAEELQKKIVKDPVAAAPVAAAEEQEQPVASVDTPAPAPAIAPTEGVAVPAAAADETK